ncbi:MAG: MATE family efflux transporter [Lachnospiraceae bacterium]|nr:MATE family efflux transporter [Lachnospiraceae bacterium]
MSLFAPDPGFEDPTRHLPFKEKFIGDRAFYRMALAVAVPIIIQNGITNFVNMRDNVMVGRVGTLQMTGVSVVNTLVFVYNLCIFGGLSGIGIFTAQFFGKKDLHGIRDSFRMKLWVGLFLTAAAGLVFVLFGEPLIRFYLHGDGVEAQIEETLSYGLQYVRIILVSFPAFMLLQVYASSLRECGETVVPMTAGLIAVVLNLSLNYLLIYGKLGFPALGVRGAALATAVSRYAELLILLIYTHTHSTKHPWVSGLYRTFLVEKTHMAGYVTKGIPLLLNEALWSSGMATLAQCYSTRGLDAVAAMNISQTVSNVLNTIYLATGVSIGILVGQRLGSGQLAEAKRLDNKMIFLSLMFSLVTMMMTLALSHVFPEVYETGPEVKALAAGMLVVYALFAPVNSFNNASYFTLRSGGKTVITFLFDSGFVWAVSVPAALLLSRFTGIGVIPLLVLVSLLDIIKTVIGYVMLRQNIWVNNIVGEKNV